MQVNFTEQQEVRLSKLASRRQMSAEQIVQDAALMLLDDAEFLAAVDEGIVAADRGEFVSNGEVWAAVEGRLKRI